MAPYAGRMTPAFAHWLIRICSNEKDVVLDPFCGIGTVPLEANLLGRQSIGFDLNPYACIVAKGKMDRRPIDEQISWLESIRLPTDEVDIDRIPEWVREFFNIETLKEILALRSILERENRYFLLGCLLGIAQGHRIGHLSKHSALTLPFKPRPDDPGEYRAVIPRMIAKVRRTYTNGIPFEPCGRIESADAREMPLENSSVDVIISSPPYFDTMDYVSSNRLRLALLGYYGDKADEIKQILIQDYKSYLTEMEKACKEMKRVLKPGKKCVLVLGDSYKRGVPINTAEKIGKIFKQIGMEVQGSVEDSIPLNKSVQRTPRSNSGNLVQRLDRIMLIKK
jgi:SAM-dependent methyltransferase